MVKERDLMGDALMLGENKNIKRFVKATIGVDYFISFENNEIIQDLQKGYTLNDKVIRYSKVIVCKK